MKKLVALFVIASLSLSLVGCTGGKTNPSEGTESDSKGNPSGEPEPAGSTPEDGGMVSEEPVTFTMFIDHSWYPVEEFTGIIPEEITKRTNVTLNPTVALDGEQLGVLIASGDLPDLVYTQNMVTQMSEESLCYSYEDLLTEYQVNWDISPKRLGIARGYAEDNKAYTILNHYSEKAEWEGSSSVPMVGTMLYRRDLWESAGSPKLESFEDLYEVFGKVKEQNPEMTMLKLTDTWNTATLRYLKGMGDANFIPQEDGSYLHYSRDPRYKEVLSWVNRCMRAGYMSPDESFFVKGSEAVPAGSWFMQTASTQNAVFSSYNDTRKVTPDAVVAEMLPFPESKYITSNIGWSGTFITKQNHNPEAAIRFIAWMFTPEAQELSQMGREGAEYTLDEKGLPVFSDEWTQAIADSTHNKIYNPWFYLGGSEIVEADSRVASTPPELCADTYQVIRERYENRPWIKAAEPIGTSDEKIIFDKVTELIRVYNAKIIMADSDEAFEAMYNEYIQNVESTGVTEVEEYVTAKVTEIMPLYQ